tara:strand:+ start:1905 stop:4172 length:2268 start_codon:yes stop_codon:yes gene_type:complete
MIITENKNKQVVRSHDFDEVKCTIDAEDMRYVASLLRNNYSNTRLAVVREITANALDANLEANASRPIEVKLPTSMNPSFAVRDFGGGLSKEDVFGLYSKYGKSTKRTSNNYIGAFGIGKFAPLSYGDNFTCTSFHGGLKIAYNVFVDESDDTKIVELFSEPSNEPTGLSIEVAVSDGDINDFKDICQKFFKFFSKEDMPKLIGVEEDFIKENKITLESKDDSWFFLDEDSGGYRYGGYHSHVIMGRVSYPLDSQALNVKKFVQDDQKARIIAQIIASSNFYLRVPLGSVKLHHSRESLEYNKTTQQKIIDSLLVVVDQIQEIAKEKLADSTDLFDAKRNYARIVNAMPYGIRSVFENSFEWNGVKIESSVFHRDYQLQDNLILTHSWKEDDSSSRNGFKIRSQKVTRVECQDNYLFVMQDLESAHGMNLRVRTLMNADDSLKGVYVIRAVDSIAEDHIYNEWNFNLIDKKHIRYASNVEKEKVQHSGVRKKNGSRANIPLFKMVTQKANWQTKNLDFWENVKDKIEDASSVDGAYNGKLVYIPIKNYKIEYNEYELGTIYGKMQRFNALQESEKNKVSLFGVRVGDVKKLDDSIWISFDTFYKQVAKDFLLSDINSANASYTHQKLKSDPSGLSIYVQSLGKLFINNFVMNKKSHSLNVVAKNWTMFADIGNNTAYNYIQFLRNSDKEWLESNLTQLITAKELLTQLKLVEKQYPLLFNIADMYSSWKGIEENNLLKNLNEYISLCDDNREGEG